MRRHKFRHRSKRVRGFFPGFLWVFILLMIFSKGHWWPAIFIVIGIYFLFGSIFREERQPSAEPAPQTSPQPAPQLWQTAAPKPSPAEPPQQEAELPTHCPKCGGPVRAYEVKNAACAYCGASLQTK
ncbi:MAG: hypothetical protein IT310_01115 [Anaerolineales bacterium]|nr:hypothetical protein [Anaerolineales bacterium]